MDDADWMNVLILSDLHLLLPSDPHLDKIYLHPDGYFRWTVKGMPAPRYRLKRGGRHEPLTLVLPE